MSVQVDHQKKNQNRFISKSFNSHQFKQHSIIKEELEPNLVKKMYLNSNKQNQVSLDFDSNSAINQSCGQPKHKRPLIPFKESKSLDKSISNSNYKLASTLIFNQQVEFDNKSKRHNLSNSINIDNNNFNNVKSHKQLPLIRNNNNSSNAFNNQSGEADQQLVSNQMFYKNRLKNQNPPQQQVQPSLQQQLMNQQMNNQQQLSQHMENIFNRSKLKEQIKEKQQLQPLEIKKKNKLVVIDQKEQLQKEQSKQKEAQLQRYQQLQQAHQQQQNQLQIINIQQLLSKVKGKPFGDNLQEIEKVSTNEVNKKQFELSHVVGKGGFGKVWKVREKKSKLIFAMKDMLKAKVIVKKSVHSVMNERNLLANIKNDFIVNMKYAFQDKLNLYLIMDYLPGGDLRYHIGQMRRFSEKQTKFFAACLLLGLEHLHKNCIIHRDIKPENLVLDSKGYLRITDLGIARQIRPDNSQDTSGTPGYMAPEIMCRQNHAFEVDYFALGVIIYEFMLGKRPYYGRNRKEIRDSIISKQVQLTPQDLPHDWSTSAMDLVNSLIQRKPQHRLGYAGIHQIIDHPWFNDIDWIKLNRKQIPSPYRPPVYFHNIQSKEQRQQL